MAEINIPTNYREMRALLRRISGKDNFIGCPRLYVDLFDGDLVAAVFLNQAIFLDGENDNPIGFDRTAQQWERDLGLSPFQSRRAGRLCEERGFVSILFKKSYKTPKNHYLIIWPALIQALNDLIQQKKQVSDLQQSAMSEASDLQQSAMSELQQSARSKELQQSETSLIQEENQSRKNEEDEDKLPAIEADPKLLLGSIGEIFDPKIFGKLTIRSEFESLSPACILGWVAKAEHDKKRLKSPIAFIASRLSGSKDPDPYYVENARDILPEAYLQKVGLWEPIGEEIEDPDPEPGETVAPPEDPEASRAWESIREQVSRETPRASYIAHIEPTRAVEIDDRSLVIWTPSLSSCEWLEERVRPTAERIAVGIFNHSVSVSFVTGNPR